MNILHRLVVPLGLTLAAFSALGAPPTGKFGFKGIELGSGIAAVANNPKYECRAVSTPAADTVCGLRFRERETIAGAPVGSLFFFYFDGKLTSIVIHLEEKHFARVVEALRGKYGNGRVSTEWIRNLKEVSFENRTHTWKTPTETLTAQRYSGRVNQSSIRFTADELIRRIEERRAAVAKDPRKDL